MRDDPGAHEVDAVVGELDGVDPLASSVENFHALVHRIAEYEVGLAVDHGIQLGLRVARNSPEIAFLQTGLLEEQRPNLLVRAARGRGHDLALDVFWLTDVPVCEAHHAHRSLLQQHAGRDDRGALHCRTHHGRQIDITERGGLRGDRLGGGPGAAAFLDL